MAAVVGMAASTHVFCCFESIADRMSALNLEVRELRELRPTCELRSFDDPWLFPVPHRWSRAIILIDVRSSSDFLLSDSRCSGSCRPAFVLERSLPEFSDPADRRSISGVPGANRVCWPLLPRLPSPPMLALATASSKLIRAWTAVLASQGAGS